MTPYSLFAPLTKRLCVPATSGVAWCLHTCDPMFQSLYFSNRVYLRFLWMHIYRFTDLTFKRGSVGQSEGLLIPRSSVRFRLNPDNSNSHRFELYTLSIKGSKLLLKVIKAIINISHEKVKFCVYLHPYVLPNQAFIHIFPIHLNTYSRGDVYTMRGNKSRLTCIHNAIYTVPHKHKFIE